MNMLVSGAALVIACVSFIGYDVVVSREATAHDLSIQAQVAASNSVAAILFNDPGSAASTLAAFKSAPNIIWAAIRTADGQPFAEYWRGHKAQIPDLPAIPADGTEARRFTNRDVVEARTIVSEGKCIGFIYIETDRRRFYARLERYALIVAAVLVASLFVALAISSGFQKSIAGPIVNLAGIARAVSRDKDYSVRANPVGGGDELAVLVEAFNAMLAQIQERDGALREARDGMEKKVEERTEQLTAANKELEAFAYSVSHDLRAPLRGIDGFSKILLDDYAGKFDENGERYLHRIRAGAQRMGTLIEDLLNLARVTRGDFHKATLDISSLARDVLDELQSAQPERQVTLGIRAGLEAEADPGLVRIVLDNLLGNAWKFTSKRASARIDFGEIERNGTWAYFVRDDGAGFDPAHADKLFGVFQRLHAMEEFPGTGIGLATVQRIIHRHGGRIWAESEKGRGATFYFTLSGAPRESESSVRRAGSATGAVKM
jgi:signal transduction histidine kinase